MPFNVAGDNGAIFTLQAGAAFQYRLSGMSVNDFSKSYGNVAWWINEDTKGVELPVTDLNFSLSSHSVLHSEQ